MDVAANPSRSRKYGCLGAVVGLTVLFVTVPFRGLTWDGGFPELQYRLTVVDPAGRPVPGVELHVLTRAGGPSYFYPINEFLPDHTPTSDADGRMAVHHLTRGVEFGGRVTYNQLGHEFGETKAPEYVCVFRIGGREVGRIRYPDLCPRDDKPQDQPWSAGRIPNADWAWKKYVAHYDDWDRYSRRLFDGNGDGELDREERIARSNFLRFADGPDDRPAQYHTVERRVTVSP